jgi:hypothetical protein
MFSEETSQIPIKSLNRVILSQLFGRINLSMDAAEATLGDFGELLEAAAALFYKKNETV